jgi:ribonuclease HII
MKKENMEYKPSWYYEELHYNKGYINVAGIDEVGRGPLAGPVVAAAVILDRKKDIAGINDSKKLSEKKRNLLYSILTEEALAIGIGIVDEDTIDLINIRNATHLAMKKAIADLKIEPDFLLIDAESLKDIKIPQLAIIKGDCRSFSIAAASIIAKVERDRIIVSYESVYPGYGFARHKGYGTKEHFECIRKYGLLPIHRRTFTKNI